MSSMNKVILMGRLAAQPKLTTSSMGDFRLGFDIATNRTGSHNGKSKEYTDYHKVVFWGDHAEKVSKFLDKGVRVYIEGRLTTRKFNGKYYTEVVVERFKFMDKKQVVDYNVGRYVKPETGFASDDIPF